MQLICISDTKNLQQGCKCWLPKSESSNTFAIKEYILFAHNFPASPTAYTYKW